MGTATKHSNSMGCVAQAAGTFTAYWSFDIPADVSARDEFELTIAIGVIRCTGSAVQAVLAS